MINDSPYNVFLELHGVYTPLKAITVGSALCYLTQIPSLISPPTVSTSFFNTTTVYPRSKFDENEIPGAKCDSHNCRLAESYIHSCTRLSKHPREPPLQLSGDMEYERSSDSPYLTTMEFQICYTIRTVCVPSS
jgi:hypothetical protein